MVGVDNIREFTTEAATKTSTNQEVGQAKQHLCTSNTLFIYFFAVTTTIKMPKFAFYGGR